MPSIKDIQNTTSEEIVVKAPRKRKGGKFSFLLFIAVVVLGVLYYQQHQELSRLKDPALQTEYAEKQVKKVIDDMKKYVVIPDDEELKLLGIISNAEALKKDQAFYTNVENGDYVFLLSKTARALIWRPEDKKVVNFGAANLQPAQQQQVTQPAPVKEESVKEVKKEDKKTDN